MSTATETKPPRPSGSKAYTSLVKALWLSWVRDRSQLFFTIMLPLMFLVLLSSVFGSVDSTTSRVLTVGDVSVLEHADEDEFEISEASDLDAAMRALEEGDADAAVVQDGQQVTIYYSQTDATAGAIAEGKLSALVDEVNLEHLSAAAPEVPLIAVETDAADDESLEPVQYLAPGILAWGIAISGVFGAAGTIVDWKRDKLLRRLRLTPASAGRFIAARISVNLTVTLIQTVVFLGVAAAFLGLKLSSWTWFAIPLVLLGTFSFLAIGVVIGGIVKTGPGAAGLSNLVTMPMAFVSGAFWPLSLSPEWVQWFAKLSPMTYLNEAIQAVVVSGHPPTSVLSEMAFLVVFAVVIFAIAMKSFNIEEL